MGVLVAAPSSSDRHVNGRYLKLSTLQLILGLPQRASQLVFFGRELRHALFLLPRLRLQSARRVVVPAPRNFRAAASGARTWVRMLRSCLTRANRAQAQGAVPAEPGLQVQHMPLAALSFGLHPGQAQPQLRQLLLLRLKRRSLSLCHLLQLPETPSHLPGFGLQPIPLCPLRHAGTLPAL